MRKILVKVGGETLLAAADRARLAADLKQVLDAGADRRLCVVHGAGPQITALGQRLGLQSTFRAGRRVTDEPMLDAVAMAMCGQVGPALLAACMAAGLPAVSTPAASGGLAVGKKRPPKAVPGEAELVDYGLVADLAAVDAKLLETLWSAGFVPLLSSLVSDPAGQLLNLNADSLVTGLTRQMAFSDVVLVTGVLGVFRDLGDPTTHLPELRAHEIDGLIASGAVQGGMIAKLQEVREILARGADTVWIVGFKEPGAIANALAGGSGLRTRVTVQIF
jgi:acetylglutamate kinase